MFYFFFVKPIDPNTGLKRLDHPKRHGKTTYEFHAKIEFYFTSFFFLFFRIPCKTFSLNGIFEGDETAINSLLNLLRDDQQGLPFVKDQFIPNLPEYSFIAIEAIWWSIEHCDDIKSEEQALKLFQVNKKKTK